MGWQGSASLPEEGTLASLASASGSPVDLGPNSLSYPDARMEVTHMDSFRADSGRCISDFLTGMNPWKSQASNHVEVRYACSL